MMQIRIPPQLEADICPRWISYAKRLLVQFSLNRHTRGNIVNLSKKTQSIKILFCSLLLPGLLSGCAAKPLDSAAPGKEANQSALTADFPKKSIVEERGKSSQERGGTVNKSAIFQEQSPINSNPKPVEENLYPGTGQFVTPKGLQASPAIKLPEGKVTLNFVDTDIREVVRSIFSEVFKSNYVIDPKVVGTITVRTSHPVEADDLLVALEEALRLIGATIVKSSDSELYKILPANYATLGNSSPATDRTGKNKFGLGIQIVPLNFVSAEEMHKILEPMSPKGSILRIDSSKNIIIIAGTQRELDAMLDTIELFDVDWLKGMSVGLFQVDFVDAKVLIEELKALFKLEGEGPISGMVRLIPVDRINGVLVISTQPEYLKRIGTWIKRLDKTGSDEQKLFVYYVQNGRADQIAKVLIAIFSNSNSSIPSVGLAPGTKPVTVRSPTSQKPSLSTDVKPAGSREDVKIIASEANNEDIKIIASEDNNALLIHATEKKYRMVENALQKLDIVPMQVFIEATVAEVTLTKDLSYGLQWFLKRGNSSFTLSETNSNNIASKFPGFSFLATGNVGITTILNALESITDLKVISSPQIMVLNNHEAKLKVGKQVPVVTMSAQDPAAINSTTIISGVEYRDTGTMLTVKPRVNSNGLLTMEIDQEVSDVSSTTVSGIASPTIQQQKISSTVAVQSGETIALGGLIMDKSNQVNSGIPLLNKVPGLGALFGGTDRTNERTELLVLITPRVVSSMDEVRQLTDELRQKLKTVVPLNKKLEKSDEKSDMNFPNPLRVENEDSLL
ncbi:MAG: type II secretion system secretin GspD [Magnetococcales bacterium]|nr:type II secretion system secretin GspD [Magnetococcales bacterium]